MNTRVIRKINEIDRDVAVICSDNEAEPRRLPCRRCNGTGAVFVATGHDWRHGDTLGYDDDCPQCGGSGEEETAP